MKNHRVLFLFIDGLGIGGSDPQINPVHAGNCPYLARLLAEHAVPIDATLGVPGYPQSATGQAALLTGENAAALMGRHMEGFPGPKLKTLIREKNIFLKLKAIGLKSTFANAYFIEDSAVLARWRMQSVTTVATLSTFGAVRDRHQMEKNEAVYQDIVRDELRPRGYTGPRISPTDAAEHLVAIVLEHDFTMFEYFQTDRAGHSGDSERVKRILSIFDGFLAALLEPAERGDFLLLLTSDHGNIEDMGTGNHTMNPVPFIAVGPGADFFKGRIKSLVDVTPVLIEWLDG
jgi:2,3-bisphosphoglycerate-independent phosphoglycerate mutase